MSLQLNKVQFDPSLLSAFGTLETNELTPVFQGDFVYGLNTQLWNTPAVNGTGAIVDTNVQRLRIQSGTGGSGNYAYVTSKKILRYRAGQGSVARFTPVFTAGVTSSLQLFGIGSIVSNAPYDGYFFGYNGTAFGIAYYNAGSLTWIPQTQWLGNQVLGNNGENFKWDPTKGSPVMIKYPYLGYGNVQFFVQNQFTSEWVKVHTTMYANTSTSVELSNPSLQFIGFTSSSGSVTNLTMYAGSVGVFTSGVRNFISNPKRGIDNSKTGISTETNILTIKNCNSYNGVTNRGMIRFNTFSFASNTNQLATLLVKINATLGGTPAYTPIDGATSDNGATITAGNSIASYDTSGTTVTGGIYVFNINLGQASNSIVDLTLLDIMIAPGDTITFSAKSTGASTLGVSVNFSEDI